MLTWIIRIKNNSQKHTKIIYVQDTFTVHKGHIKCPVAQKEAHWPPFFVLIFNLAISVDIKNILYKKSLIRLITGTNLFKPPIQSITQLFSSS